jgi:Secretion system C-terminal sorting domain
MKKKLLSSLALVALAMTLHAQTILIGLNNNQTTGLASVIRWNAVTGTMLDSVVTTQPGSVMGSSAFDAVNQTYYFDGSVKVCRVGFNPSSFGELASSGITSSTEVDMATGKIFSVRSVGVYDSLGNYVSSQTEFVRYNIADSTEIVMGVLPSILGFYLDVNCYNSNSGTYYFIGVDSVGASILVSIPTRGTSFSPRLVPVNVLAGTLFTLEYDNNDDILYGLSNDGALTWHLQIQQIDTLTGALTLEADFPQLIGYLMTTTTYDQATGSMIMVAIDTNQNYTLYNYATSTNVLSTLLSPYAGEFGELECDNSVFAGVKYGQVTAVATPASLTRLTLYPNPAQDQLHIASSESIVELYVIDLLGKSMQLPFSTTGNTVDVHTLAQGSYILRARLESGLWAQEKFIKR